MKKVIIIGGGPIGLNIAKNLDKKSINYVLIEASDKLGGQLTELYPHKDIVDIPGIVCIKAEDYIKELVNSLNLKNILLNTRVDNIIDHKEYVEVLTKEGTFTAEFAIICTGLGFYTPRTMGLENEAKYDNILYSLKSFEFLKDKHVVIFGGGDSALDWAKGISNISDHVSLVHRRMEFRGNADTIKNCSNLNVYLPYVPNKLIEENGKLVAIEIKNVNDSSIKKLECDYVLVNYGNIPSPMNFDIPHTGCFATVDENYKCSNRIFAVGDASSYEGKIKRIAPGLKEIEAILKQII